MSTEQTDLPSAGLAGEAEVLDMVDRITDYLTSATVVVGIQLAERLGIYRFMAPRGELRADEVADGVGCNRHLIQEWLDGQVAAGLIEMNSVADTYCLTHQAAMVLAYPSSPVFMAKAMAAAASLTLDLDSIERAYRTNGALAWNDHHPGLTDGTEWLTRPEYEARLTTHWIPALENTAEKLEAGAHVLDVGCGHGAAMIDMARAYPTSTFVGLDSHAPSVDMAKKRAADAGVADRCRFEVGDAHTYDGTFDLITFFHCLHQLGDPVGAAIHARAHLAEGGSVLVVEPFAVDERGDNIATNPLATLQYNLSAMVSMPHSLSEEVGRPLGAQAGQERLREVFEQAGYQHLIRRAGTPFSLILQAHG